MRPIERSAAAPATAAPKTVRTRRPTDSPSRGRYAWATPLARIREVLPLSCPSGGGATLIGNGPDALTRVTMIGNDMRLDSGIGVCGKEGQSVPVGVGQPTLKIEGLTVGGTGS